MKYAKDAFLALLEENSDLKNILKSKDSDIGQHANNLQSLAKTKQILEQSLDHKEKTITSLEEKIKQLEINQKIKKNSDQDMIEKKLKELESLKNKTEWLMKENEKLKLQLESQEKNQTHAKAIQYSLQKKVEILDTLKKRNQDLESSFQKQVEFNEKIRHDYTEKLKQNRDHYEKRYEVLKDETKNYYQKRWTTLVTELLENLEKTKSLHPLKDYQHFLTLEINDLTSKLKISDEATKHDYQKGIELLLSKKKWVDLALSNHHERVKESIQNVLKSKI